MEPTDIISDKDKVVERGKSLIINWIEKNAPDEVSAVQEKIQGIKISVDQESSFYSSSDRCISISKHGEEQSIVHEIIHAISDIRNGDTKIRQGIIHNDNFLPVDEAITELSTLVFLKGAEYIANTDVNTLIQSFREYTVTEPGYMYATEYVLRKIKEGNLNAEQINEIVTTYLFRKENALIVKTDIQRKLGINDMENEIREFQIDKGYELLNTTWELFKNANDSNQWKDKRIVINNQEISIEDFFKPFEVALEIRYLKVYWDINEDWFHFKKRLDNQINIKDDLYINLSLLYALMAERSNPDIANKLQTFVISKAKNVYDSLNRIENTN